MAERWLGELLTMQAHARRRGWDLVQLEIDPPATEAEIRGVEIRHGLTMPAQLREVLLQISAQVHFGWSIPSLLHPLEGLNLPTSGGLHDSLWSLDHIDQKAIVSFNGLRDHLANLGDGEEPNTPEMWNNQFPFAAVGEGDVLTIDMSLAKGPQPVRYFSSEREGLHHHVIAPDFFSFITAYTRLGCAGRDHDDWFRFIAQDDGDLRYLDPDSEGGRRWRAWLARDPHRREPDEPPEPVPAKTRSDFNLLDAAHDGSSWGIEAALAAGAVLDCVDGNQPNREGRYGITYETALVYAVRRGDLGLIERPARCRRQHRHPPAVGQRGDPHQHRRCRAMAHVPRRARQRMEGRPLWPAACVAGSVGREAARRQSQHHADAGGAAGDRRGPQCAL
jgi:SMI1/KNR4 family protein SUKH-1